jgi:hypothetical protein
MAVAGGERAFMKMLARKEVIGRKLLDQTLYPVTADQQKICEQYSPSVQDFDRMYKHLNIVSKETVKQIKERYDRAFAQGCVITIAPENAPPVYKYRRVQFFRV